MTAWGWVALVGGVLLVWMLVDVLSWFQRRSQPGRRADSVAQSIAAVTLPAKPRTYLYSQEGEVANASTPEAVEATQHPIFQELAPMLDAGDWGAARRFLQKIAYGIQTATPDEQRIFKTIMTAFAKADPMYQRCLQAVLPLVAQSPGIKQTALYPHMAAAPDTEHARYVLYFAHELGHIVRKKKGNSYQVFLPEATGLEHDTRANTSA